MNQPITDQLSSLDQAWQFVDNSIDVALHLAGCEGANYERAVPIRRRCATLRRSLKTWGCTTKTRGAMGRLLDEITLLSKQREHLTKRKKIDPVAIRCLARQFIRAEI